MNTEDRNGMTSRPPAGPRSTSALYLFDSDSPDKQAKARRILEANEDRIVLSTQVLGEFNPFRNDLS